MIILNGKEVAKSLRKTLKTNLSKIPENHRKPGLAVIQVGNDAASAVYVRNKKKACEKTGIYSIHHHLAENISEPELTELIENLNQDSSIDGILLQLPLPPHLNEDKMLDLINPCKDVDGFHPCNMGKILQGRGELFSCTPAGIIEILKYYKIPTSGKRVVIAGRSNIVGKPLAAMLMQKGADATVTVAHSRSQNLAELCREADILVGAVGKPEFIKACWLKKGAVVVDVGINRIEKDGTEFLVGDVEYNEACEVVSAITPVPGGVGPMTITMLLHNTCQVFFGKYPEILKGTS